MMRTTTSWLAAVGVLSVAALAACASESTGSTLSSSGAGGSGGSGGAQGGGAMGGDGGGVVAGCPVDPPLSGVACTPPGAACTYPSYGNSCCSCTDLGGCVVWECVNPANNDAACAQISAGTHCEGTFTPSCSYCNNGVPQMLVCDLGQQQYVEGEITVCQ